MSSKPEPVILQLPVRAEVSEVGWPEALGRYIRLCGLEALQDSDDSGSFLMERQAARHALEIWQAHIGPLHFPCAQQLRLLLADAVRRLGGHKVADCLERDDPAGLISS